MDDVSVNVTFQHTTVIIDEPRVHCLRVTELDHALRQSNAARQGLNVDTQACQQHGTSAPTFAVRATGQAQNTLRNRTASQVQHQMRRTARLMNGDLACHLHKEAAQQERGCQFASEHSKSQPAAPVALSKADHTVRFFHGCPSYEPSTIRAATKGARQTGPGGGKAWRRWAGSRSSISSVSKISGETGPQNGQRERVEC